MRSDQYRVSESHSFSPTKVNVFNFTYNWYRQADQSTASGNYNSQLGFGNTGATNFPAISFGNAVNGYGVTSIGNTIQGSFAGANVITGDTFTWVKGRHSLSFGGDFHAYQVNSHKGSGALSFNFVPDTTSGGYTTVAGFGFASYLLGDVANASETTPFAFHPGDSIFLQAGSSWAALAQRFWLRRGAVWHWSETSHPRRLQI